MGDPDTHQGHIPKKLLSEYIPDGLRTAVVESWQGNHEFYSSMLNSSQYLVDLSQSGSNHFLREDMFACLSSSDHHIMMKEIGRASCRKECRSRWSPDQYRNNKTHRTRCT